VPNHSKFTADAREKALEARAFGAPLSDCAAYAGVDPRTMGRWLERGKNSAERGGIYADFHAEWLRVTAAPRIRALRIWHEAMADKPELAVKFAERQIDGYAQERALTQVAVGSPIVELSFPDTRIVQDAELVEGQVIDIESQSTSRHSLPAPTGS
jgi:hypothetical protein